MYQLKNIRKIGFGLNGGVQMNHAGAIASNAGDDFHLIWAAKKIVDMLKPESKLNAVVVEGPTWDDSVTIEDQTLLYSIDISEYYGGVNFQDAKRVIFSQLKYSAYLPDKEWNLSRLCLASDNRNSNSIIRRMADTYKGFAKLHGDISNKVLIKLVSNQKISSELVDIIKKCKDIIGEYKYKYTANMLNKLEDDHRMVIEKLYAISKLPSGLFVQFIQTLDFDDCGTDVRDIHEMELMQQIGKWGFNNTKSSYNDLVMAIRKCMLPEGEHTTIDRNWVKAKLGVEERNIFPAPARLVPISGKYIKKSGEEEISKAILESRKQWTCLHATAGAGKTSFVRNLKDYLPDDSVVVLYDCYGGGAFLQPDQPRHKMEMAIPQICNMLAVECKTELLLRMPEEEHLCWSSLKDRLLQASIIVQEKNPEAVIALIIDAADNSVFAANRMKEDCFLKKFLELEFPHNVRVILTARTERRMQLPYIDVADKYSIPLFEKDNSAEYLRAKFPDATNDKCEEFHMLTNGNPRLQNYILSNASLLNEVLEFVRPNGKLLEDVFCDFIEAAKKQYTSMVEIGLLFYAISSLIRPVPIKIICDICDISVETLHSMCIECHFGFYVKSGELSFRDEDFEEYLRLNYSENKEYANIIADYMFNERDRNSYCARYVHVYLDQANQFDRLVQIALNEEIDGATVGVAQSNKIMIDRIRAVLARPEMLDKNNRLIACELIYKEVDFCAGEDILSKLINDAPEEIILYCDEMSIHEAIERSDNSFESLGKKAYLAAYIKDDVERIADYINIYIHRMHEYYNSNHQERLRDRPDNESIIRVAVAMVKIGEISSAYKLLTRWQPKKAAIQLVTAFFRKILVYGRGIDLKELLRIRWSLPNMLAILCAHITEGKRLPVNLIENMDTTLERIKHIPMNRFSLKCVIQYLEYKIMHDDGNDIVCRWIDKIENIPLIPSDMSFYDDDKKKSADVCFRYYALKSICKNDNINVESFFDDKQKKRNEYKDKNDTLEKCKFLYDFYIFRVKGNQYESNKIDTYISDYYKKLEIYRYHVAMNLENQYTYEWAGLLFLEGIVYFNNIKQETIYNWVTRLFENGSWRTQFLIKAMELFARTDKTYSVCIYVVNRIDDMLKQNPEYAESMVDTYLQCTKATLKIDPLLGKEFFKKAITCTREADIHSYRKVDLFYILANKCGKEYKQSNEIVAYKIAGISENYLKRITDTKNFPYENAIAACTSLSERGIWSILCRMDDRNQYDWLSIQDTLPTVLKTLLDNKKIKIWQLVAVSIMLLPGRTDEYYKLMQQVLENMNGIDIHEKRRIFKIFMDDILYNVPMNDKLKFINCLIDYLDKAPKDPELNTQEIRTLGSFLEQLNSEREYSDSLLVNSRDGDLRNELCKITEDSYISKIEELLDQIAEVSGKYSVYHLESIAKFVEKKSYVIEINNWRNDISVKKKYFIKLMGKVMNYYWDNSLFEQLNRIFRYSVDEKYEFMLAFLIEHKHVIADDLVHSVSLITDSLENRDVSRLLEWIVDNEWKCCCETYSGSDANFADTILQETEYANIDYYIARFIWRMFGHPDKKNRFWAQHVLWRYVYFESNEIMSYLFELYCNNNISNMYLDNGNYFFIESAQISFLETSLFLADWVPESLHGYYEFYKKIAANDATQHALKRHLSIKICKRIISACAATESVELDEYEKCIVNNKNMYKYERESDSKRTFSFHIDTMDTTRYWYDDVAELFGCTQGDVAELCDFYISNVFNITNQVSEEWQKKYYHQQYYGRASNDHGAIPSYETLRKYAEWHSMFYAADYLRRTSAIVDDEELDYGSWLDLFLPGMDDVWSYEMRSYPPLLEVLWNPEYLSAKKGNVGYSIPENFVETLKGDTKKILLNLESQNVESQCRKSILLTSVVVEEHNFIDFISELKKDSYAIYDYLYREEDMREKKNFCVYATCIDKGYFSEKASDMSDPLSKGHLEMQNCNLCLSPSVFSDVGTITLKELRARENRKDAFVFYKWCEPVGESGYDKIGTYGYMLSVDRDYLVSVLQQNAWSLICKVKIELEDEYRGYYVKRDRISQEFLWIMKKNGDTEVIKLKEERR